MSYEEICDYLFSKTANYEKQGAQGYKPGLATTRALDAHYGHPHRQFQTIHVAGTNGKGSVSHLTAAWLQECGYRVGLYTSPHLLDFSERIRVNGQPIPKDYVVDFVEKGREFWEPMKPSFFEIATAMAFRYFAVMDVDIAVVEVGLGGRLDCTNIINPLLSIITNISTDHTQLLGDTLAEIAAEKGGIIKRGVPVVIGEAIPETRPVFDRLAKKANAPIHYAEDEPEVLSATLREEAGFHYTTCHFGELDCELGGICQSKNTNTVLVAIRQLMASGALHDHDGQQLSEETSLKALDGAFRHVTSLTGLMGRWQHVGEHPTIVCDTGHNLGGWQYLGEQLSRQKCHNLHIVFGMMKDKDVEAVMALLPKKATYYFTKGSTTRALPEISLKMLGAQNGLHGECYATVAEAIQTAKNAATTDDFIFVGGSTYVVADFLRTCL